MMSDAIIRRSSANSQHNPGCSSSNPYVPMIGSPLASSYPDSVSSPLSCVSSTDVFQLIPSSPTNQSILPSDEVEESDVEMPSSECDMILIGDNDQSKFASSSRQISLFDLPGSGGPGDKWQPGSTSNRRERLGSDQSINQRSATWKQPTTRSSPRSSTFGETPMSSPSPLSRAYTLKANLSNRSPSELRQQAANRLRTIERKNRLNAHRPLLDAFTIGTRRGVDETTSNRDEMMAEAIGRRHIRHMNRQWEELLSSQACATDELIEEAEEHGIPIDEEFLDCGLDIDPSEIYAEYEVPDDAHVEQDTSMTSTASTVQPDHAPKTLLSTLLISPSLCPSCSGGTLTSSQTVPPGVECSHCHWALNGSILQSVDNHFHQHGDRAYHQPVVGYHPHIGTNFFCSNSQCEEMICV